MKIAVIGGGPAGLYFAILLKTSRPEIAITIHERNKADDLFGFGVVFSDQTLDTFKTHDLESYEAIRRSFAYWDDIEIHFKDTVHRIGGNGFCGCSRRTLLMLLQERARGLGVAMQFGSEIADEAALDADMIVIADGLNSALREKHRAHFGTRVDLRPNKFSWMGSTRPFDAFNYFFRETRHGVFIAHCYQYEANASTWVLETTPETWASAGLDRMSEHESARFMEGVFANELQGHSLQTNRSIWRNFPMIRNERWVKDNMVLLGDAKATAHFSIGSGTKLAMEDAIALYKSVLACDGVDAALSHFETTRRQEVERTQHAADTSLVWFEDVQRFWDMDPVQFAFGLMTRSKAITYDNLTLRAPDFVAAVDDMMARDVAAKGITAEPSKAVAPMFQPYRLRDMHLANRVVVSPMCMYSAEDGLPGDFHLVHYGARAMGGAGLIVTEMTCPSADARITPGCTGLWNDAQQAAWTRLVDFVHANSEAKICLQLGHAGRKGASKLMWDGMDRPLPDGGWGLIAPSPLPYYPESQVPRAMTVADMAAVMAEFVAAARRAEACGFDMLELHCAHGYLLASFLSPVTNQRTDQFGGSLDNRVRFPLAVFEAVRAVWPSGKPMSVRISATDWIAGGLTPDDAVEISRAFARAGADLIDVSSGQTAPQSKPHYGRMFQTPFSDQIRNEAGIATMAVGSITGADQINTIIAAGRADLVALGRPHLADPAFTLRAAAWYGDKDHHSPKQYAPGRDALYRQLEKERADLTELRLKARPKSHAPEDGTGRMAAE
ncbi:MAG: bifunctional salicylyl-CoA 5-hydroxylase/oxidoreductase [Beijerinckiaceae bacterium]|nr:bifunctional salicylyl-CoA 5-hydroxylase/oxidoreductase [Beijerinckiaceae bacterium]